MTTTDEKIDDILAGLKTLNSSISELKQTVDKQVASLIELQARIVNNLSLPQTPTTSISPQQTGTKNLYISKHENDFLKVTGEFSVTMKYKEVIKNSCGGKWDGSGKFWYIPKKSFENLHNALQMELASNALMLVVDSGAID